MYKRLLLIVNFCMDNRYETFTNKKHSTFDGNKVDWSVIFAKQCHTQCFIYNLIWVLTSSLYHHD